MWRVAQQIAPKANQQANRQHRDQIDLIKTKASVVLAPSQTPHPCCLYGVVRQPSKRILFILCDHSAVFERSCVLEKGLCSNCTSQSLPEVAAGHMLLVKRTTIFEIFYCLQIKILIIFFSLRFFTEIDIFSLQGWRLIFVIYLWKTENRSNRV